jgi:hypothetical protein
MVHRLSFDGHRSSETKPYFQAMFTALNQAERPPSIWRGSSHGIDLPLRPSTSDHSPGIGFDKKSPFSPPG